MVLLLLYHNISSQLTFPPTNFISNHDTTNLNLPYDDIYDDDVKNPLEQTTYLNWIYGMAAAPYNDIINGIIYEITSPLYASPAVINIYYLESL